jgi:hypothetical protein
MEEEQGQEVYKAAAATNNGDDDDDYDPARVPKKESGRERLREGGWGWKQSGATRKLVKTAHHAKRKRQKERENRERRQTRRLVSF